MRIERLWVHQSTDTHLLARLDNGRLNENDDPVGENCKLLVLYSDTKQWVIFIREYFCKFRGFSKARQINCELHASLVT